jgi:hemolysin D
MTDPTRNSSDPQTAASPAALDGSARTSPPRDETSWVGRALIIGIRCVFVPVRLVLRAVVTVLRWIPGIRLLMDAVARRGSALRANIGRHLTVARIAWEEARREEPLRVPRGRELEFLPAVLEIQESPPSPVGRAVSLSIAALFGAAIVWAAFGSIDIIAVAQGKIVPSDRSKIIQPLDAGVIKAIHVEDGSHVKAGDPLIDIDTAASPDQKRFHNELLASLTEIARLRALLADQDDFTPPAGASPELVQTERAHLRDQLTEYRALRNQASAYKELLDKQYVARVQYLDVEQKRAGKMNEFTAALAAAETRAKSQAQELAKAETRVEQQHLTAPIDGVVQQLAVHTVGGVVTPAQQLMVVAPDEGSVEVDATLENRDIGFVNEGQEAEIKIDAFPFTRYGTIEGKVVSLSKDAVQIDKVGLVYTARVSLSRATMRIENKEVRLSPGMTVAVEIKTGRRRVIDYFLSPLIQAARDSIRER